MESDILKKLADKSISKEQLFNKVKKNNDLIPMLLTGVSSPKASVRYGSAKVLMDLSEEQPSLLYPDMDFFVSLLESRYRILTWNAISIIANLTRVDTEKKFDSFFEKYFGLLNNEYMVTVTNVVGSAGKIALAKPYLTNQIVKKLLLVEKLSTTPHLSSECKRVIIEHTIKSFDVFFHQIQQKEEVMSFVKKQLKSPRKTLRFESENFLKKWGESM
jgi:hypothetical protein